MMKQTVLDLMRVTGAFAPFRMANRSKVLILTYHRFSETAEPAKTSAAAFADHLEYLKQHYTLLPLSQIADSLATGKPLPPGAAAITVDDGYQDFYRVAYPLLLQHRVPATLYVATDFIDNKCWLWTDKLRYLTKYTPSSEIIANLKGRTQRFLLTDDLSRLKAADRINATLKTLPNEHKEEAIKRIAASLDVLLPALPPAAFAASNWDEICEMDREGIEIGSHTVSHPILPNTTDDQLAYELTTSKETLETMLKRTVPLLCYPNGRNDSRVQRATATAGYRCAVSNQHGMNTQHTPLLCLRRIAPEPDLAHFVQSTSGFEEVKLKLRGKPVTQPATASIAINEPTAQLAQRA